MTDASPSTSEIAAVCEFLIRCGVSDHYGEGITAKTLAEHLNHPSDYAQYRLSAAVDDGYLTETPAVIPGRKGQPLAYLPAE